MSLPSIGKEIVVDLESHGSGKIFIDGRELTNVTHLEIEAGVGEPTMVTLRLAGVRLKFSAKDASLFCNTTSIRDEWERSALPEFEEE